MIYDDVIAFCLLFFKMDEKSKRSVCSVFAKMPHSLFHTSFWILLENASFICILKTRKCIQSGWNIVRTRDTNLSLKQRRRIEDITWIFNTQDAWDSVTTKYNEDLGLLEASTYLTVKVRLLLKCL